MNTVSAVKFATDTRIHVGIGVRDLERSVAFYSRLFNQEPTKVRPRYAKFEVAEPPVNLTLNEGLPDGVKSSVASHFGIQVKSTEAVTQMAERLQKEGLTPTMETGVTCCYAVQDKAWSPTRAMNGRSLSSWTRMRQNTSKTRLMGAAPSRPAAATRRDAGLAVWWPHA